MGDMNGPMGSATRHLLTGLLASALGALAMRKGIVVPEGVTTEVSGYVIASGLTAAGGAAALAGGLLRHWLGGPAAK